MTELTMAPPTAGRAVIEPGRVLAIVCAGVVLAGLDLFIVNIALPQIARDLHTRDLSELSWVLNGYAIVYASLLVYFGRLADRHRRDRSFLLGVAIFTVSSAACATANGVGLLIAFRLLQAAGSALLTPTSLGLLLASYPAEKRHGAVRIWTTVGGLAAALGPVIGGLLVAVSWRWVFIINVPVGIASLIIGWRYLPAVPGQEIERPDPWGALLVTGGVGLVTLGIVKGGAWGWASVSTLVALICAAALLLAFTVHCLVAANPLIEPALFNARHFSGASLVAIFFSTSFGAMLLSVVLWEQGVWGWSALRTGLAFAPGPLMVPLVSLLIAGKLTARYGPSVVITAGSVLFAGGLTWWALAMGIHPNYAADVLAGSLLTGAGVGLTLPVMMATASASLPAASFATGSAVINMLRQTGLAFGVAVLVAIVGDVSAPHAALEHFRTGWWVAAAISIGGAVPAIALLRRRPDRS